MKKIFRFEFIGEAGLDAGVWMGFIAIVLNALILYILTTHK